MIRGYRLINVEVENTKCGAVWYGGTFDPPHSGHQKIIQHLTDLPDVQTVIVTPAYLNPFKHDSLASPEQRLAWVHQLFDAPNIVIDDGEVRAGRSVYTAETIQRLQNDYSLSCIAIGSDNLEHIDQWHDFAWLNRHMIWLVFEREGYPDGYDKLRLYHRIPLDAPVSSSNIRQHQDTNDIDPRIIEDVKHTLIKGTK